MLIWLGNHIATILITAALIAVVIGIISVLRKDRKNGVSGCDGSCTHCAMSAACHPTKNKNS